MSVYSSQKYIILLFIKFDWLKLDSFISNSLFEIISEF